MGDGEDSNNAALLMDNLQKLEESGKVVSNKTSTSAMPPPVHHEEVKALDLVSGIISAANRKIRSQQHQNPQPPQPPPQSSNPSKLHQPQFLQQDHHNQSRRNSE